MKNYLALILISLFVSSCVKERLFDETPNEKLSPDFTPSTTPIHVLSSVEAGLDINECFYQNNYVKLIAYKPNINKYNWYRVDSFGIENLVSHDSVYVTNLAGEYRLEFEQLVFELGEIDSSIFINLDYCPTGVEIPETFIPNNDEEFNTWLPIFEGVSSFYVRISDNDDNVIFESESEVKRFDGTYQGNQLPSGSYSYYVSGMYRSGYNFEQQGVIELIN